LGAALVIAVLAIHLLALEALTTHQPPVLASVGTLRFRMHTATAPGPATAATRAPAAPTTPIARAPAPERDTPATAHPGAGASDAARDASDTRAAQVALPMGLRYEVSGQSRERQVTGRAELTWQHDGRRYEARLESDGEGLPRRSQQSAGLITPQGLAPERFSERTRHQEVAHFEREAERLVFSVNRPPAVLLPGAQDRLSLLLQLGARIAASPQAYRTGTQIAVQTVTTREALVWRFRVEGTQELQLPGGYQASLRLVRLPEAPFEPKIELWLAPALDYAPARMRLTQHTGDWLEYQWAGTDRR
jgi:hypothetical protein